MGSGEGADGADPLWLPYSGTPYIYLPGTTSNNLSVPRPAATTEYVVTYDDGTTLTKTSTANPLIFGNSDADFSGKSVRSIRLNDGAAGPQVGMFLAAGMAEPYTSYVDSFGLTWTVNRTAFGRKMTLVDADCYLFASDDSVEFAYAADIDFSLADDFALAILVRIYGTSAGQVLLAHKASGGIAGAGYSLDRGTSNNAVFRVNDGTNFASAVLAAPFTQGQRTLIAGIRSVGNDNVTAYGNGVAGTPVTDPNTLSIQNTEVVRIGRLSGAGTAYADMQFFGAAIFPFRLNARGLQRLALELAGG
jgi:hypothetical protein